MKVEWKDLHWYLKVPIAIEWARLVILVILLIIVAYFYILG